MQVIVDVKCTACDAVSETWMENSERTTDCPLCKSTAIRKISPVGTKLDQTFPGWMNRWDKAHRDGARDNSD